MVAEPGSVKCKSEGTHKLSLDEMSGGVPGPPGLGGGVGGGFGDIGQAAFNYQEMVKGMKRFKDIENTVETDSINMEK